MIRDLDNSECLKLINNLHGQIYFSKKLYCNGVVALTPEKESAKSPNLSEDPSELSTEDALLTTTVNDNIVNCLNSDPLPLQAPPNLLSPLSSPQWPIYERNELARRHSLSLLNRTPTRGSLAAELLDLNVKQPSQTETLLAHVKDLTESLSEFNS